jgi:hypothetical protein
LTTKIKFFFIGLLSFWNWFKYFPPIQPGTDPTTRKSKRQARLLLHTFLLASSILPDFGFDDFLPYHSISGNPMPSKIITSTSGLSAYNFQELETRLTSTPLFSLFKGFIATPFTPVLLDCGASACTSPTLDAFEPDSLTPLDKPVKMEGIGGNVDIKMQGIVKYQTLDDNGNPLF